MMRRIDFSMYGGDLTAVVERGLAELPRVPPAEERIVMIGGLPLRGHAVLAPMAGVCDHPFRWLCRRAGAGVVYGEFVSSDGLVRGHETARRMLRHTEDEHPIAIQVFGSDPAVVGEAVAMIEAAGADIVDLNFGCPVKKVTKREAGSALLRNPTLLGRIVRAAADAAKRAPVTAKIRAGWDVVNAEEVARIVEGNGAKAIAIHGRTQKMGYAGQANWEIIRRVKETVRIPVIGNGDVFQPADAFRMLDETGCDLVMVGRGAQGAPWVFAGINARARGIAVPALSWRERLDIAAAHLALMLREKPSGVAVMQFRGHLGHYVKAMPGSSTFRREVFAIDEPDVVLARLRAYGEELNGVPAVAAGAHAPSTEVEA